MQIDSIELIQKLKQANIDSVNMLYIQHLD